MASFSYLGLIGHPEVNDAAKAAIDRYGVGCHGVRILAGTTDLHRRLEQRLAHFVGAEDALVYPSGYATNFATIQAVVGADDCIVSDEWIHASLADGCAASGAECHSFRHNDVEQFAVVLSKAKGRRVLVVVDGVYSMEGDLSPLPEITEICRKHQAILMVDEAHSFGVMGGTGRGVQEHFGLPGDAIDVKMGCLSKALGSQGGFIAGRSDLIRFLRHSSRGYVFSTSLGPPMVAAALAGLEILEREPWRPARLRHNAIRLAEGLRRKGFSVPSRPSAIIPLLCRTEEQAFSLTAGCRKKGLYVVPVVYPAVPMNSPRLRLNVMAGHNDEDIDQALDILGRVGREVGVIG